eukprot:CAMPEP_0206600008 /NCGR_PEP_ID=MMETSP0325_2-20121206/45509_1 /ASSEMBLY_ACC=CAM_ASM_000347 /TAXON_ID=2866 /ORGANISM="Crypthecodinium cohnii, Strain Seligo" /LENGTH=351 /DNA_ID=CAMNT_0054111169 /DNA_START=236 /DNA_END=1288 /DNA_ORIENTATION=+
MYAAVGRPALLGIFCLLLGSGLAASHFEGDDGVEGQEEARTDNFIRRHRGTGHTRERKLLQQHAKAVPTQGEIVPVPAPDRTLEKVAQESAAHQGNVTEFVLSMRLKLDEICTQGACETLLDRIIDEVAKHEAALNNYVQEQLPTEPPNATVNYIADWSENFTSNMGDGMSARSGLPIDKLKCLGQFCGVMQVHYLEKDLDIIGGSWTRWFNEYPPSGAFCPKGMVAVQVQCSGLYCGRMRLLCQKADDSKWQIDDGATEERGWFTETHPGVGGCSTGYALYGIKCSGLYCHSKKLFCKGSKPPARDCRWGPWSEWGECVGWCGEAYQSRNRSLYFDEMWGGRCYGNSTGQ